MLFNSYFFLLVFLPIALAVYFFCNIKKKYLWGEVWLIVTSFIFCAWFNPYYAIILGISILGNYGMYRWIYKNTRAMGCVIGIIFNLVLLGYFKYSNFLIENINFIFQTNVTFKEVLLPIGISFYTFQQIAFLVDCYKNQNIQYSFVEYCLYVSYFPKLSQGPMAYHTEIIQQFRDEEKKNWNYQNASEGLFLLAIGLGKKVLLADVLAGIVTIGYEQIDSLNSLSALVVTFSYTLQIYFDFSGYCDMAAGISKMFNIILPVNFDLPYRATSISDFWNRWHITLTRFFTKYIYIPLGGNRKGIYRTCVNTLIVFLISGIWHGAAWTFILWGMMHGVAMVIERLGQPVIKKMPKIVRWFLTLSFVNLAWIFFRADSISQGVHMTLCIFKGGGGSLIQQIVDYINSLVEVRAFSYIGLQNTASLFPIIFVFLFYIFVFVLILKEKNYVKGEEIPLKRRHMFLTVVLLIWSFLSMAGYSEFIYFNF